MKGILHAIYLNAGVLFIYLVRGPGKSVHLLFVLVTASEVGNLISYIQGDVIEECRREGKEIILFIVDG